MLLSKATKRFWQLYAELPERIQKLAQKNYALWSKDPTHPSLSFKSLQGQPERFSVRIGDHYRALGLRTGNTIMWVWIGSHEDYNRLISR